MECVMDEPNDDQRKILSWEDHIVPILKHPDIHIRDKALTAVAWELHARPSELHRLRFGDVEDWGAFMAVTITDSKCQDRRLTLFGSTPYLRKWLQEHPVTKRLATDAEPLEEATPDTPIWTQTQRNKHLSLKRFRTITVEARVRADVRTEVTLHEIRRSRAKILALQLGLRIPALRERFGWTASEHRGLIDRDENDCLDEDVKPNAPVSCPNCGEWTPSHQPCIWCKTEH